MSKRHIGNKNEERVCWFFQHNGFVAWSPTWGGRGHGTFRSTDILGVFDVLATNKNEIVFIQVKTEGSFRKSVIDQMLKLPLPVNVRREYWTFRPDGSARARLYYSNGEFKEFSINFEEMKYEQ